MKRYYEFKEYIETFRAKTTANGYSDTINSASNDLLGYKLIEENIYMIDNIDIINNILDIYLSIPELEAKNIRSNKKISNAIRHYINFFNSKLDSNETTKDKEKSKFKEININNIYRFYSYHCKFF